MLETSGRLLRLLSLLQTPRDWSGPQLAERLEVSTRTVRKDVERLRDLGYPVTATPGLAGGYRLTAGAHMPPLILDDEEAMAVALGLRAAAGGSIQGIEETSLRALAKLEQVLPPKVRRQIKSVHEATLPLVWAGTGPTVDPDVLTIIASVIRVSERLRFAYTANDAAETRRLVEPNRLVSAGRRWYLVAWDIHRDAWRTFRVDRITAPQLTGVRATPRELPAADAAAFVQQALAASRPRSPQAVVTLHVPFEEAQKQVWKALGTLERIDDHSCRLTTHPDTPEWFAFQLATLGLDFEVHSPPELIAYLRTIGDRLGRATAVS